MPNGSTEENFALTAFSHGAGCGCKIAPAVLTRILQGGLATFPDPRLLVGYGERDDAAVFDLGNGRALISTTDFFSPIVDDPFDLGRIAATNALSDVYAMGGTPLLALGILGWPVEKIPAELAGRVLDGARSVCADAGIALAGGHSIDAPEPFFGLAVTGEALIKDLKRNSTGRPGDVLFLTKPLGIGILATALKRRVISAQDSQKALEIMCKSNSIGRELASLPQVHAMTDVTGFGLLGHLLEMCEGAGVGAELHWDSIPVIPQALHYLDKGCYPDGSFRNWKSMADKVAGAENMVRMMILSDPQTSGGLLIACDPAGADEVAGLLKENDAHTAIIGKMTPHAPDSAFLRITPMNTQ